MEDSALYFLNLRKYEWWQSLNVRKVLLLLSAWRIRKRTIQAESLAREGQQWPFRSLVYICLNFMTWRDNSFFLFLLFWKSTLDWVKLKEKSFFPMTRERVFLSFKFITYIKKKIAFFFLNSIFSLHSIFCKDHTLLQKNQTLKMRKIMMCYSAQVKIFSWNKAKWNHMCLFLFWRNSLQLWHDSTCLPNFIAK